MANSEQAFRQADQVLRYLKGELNEEEKILFEHWLKADSRNRKFLETLRSTEGLKKELEFFSEIDTDSAWDAVQSDRYAALPFYRRSIWKYAAAVLFCLATAIAYYSIGRQPEELSYVKPRFEKPKQDIAPGADKAKLILADGSVILLEEAGNGTIGTHSGVRISKKDGMLVYEVLATPEAELSYNTISTPRGGQYQVLLPDGSRVWLNASSSLNYPTAFTGKDRIVKLSGEAYFEISKNREQPFKVLANGTEVEVLGTHFNVKAYPDENTMNTTLLEGSVKISKGAVSRTIIPGQHASIDKSNAFEIADADVNEAVAWKDGVFLFNNQGIQVVMRELGRWYDADISYEGDMPTVHFTGKISRNNNISKVLNLLELTGGVRFKIEDKKVKVYK